MPRVSIDQAVEKWQRRTSAAGQDYIAGVQRVTTHPGQLAARNVQGYINGVNAAVQNGKWQTNVAAGTLQDWQDAAVNKGAPRLAQGVQAAGPKMAAALGRVFPMIDAAQREVQGMDRSTPENRIARATAFMTSMYKQGQASRRR